MPPPSPPQTLLLAELCLGRNYLCISGLEAAYSFDLLLTGMKLSVLPPQLRAAFCSLMSCL